MWSDQSLKRLLQFWLLLSQTTLGICSQDFWIINSLADSIQHGTARGAHDITGYTAKLYVSPFQYLLDAVHHLGTLTNDATPVPHQLPQFSLWPIRDKTASH